MTGLFKSLYFQVIIAIIIGVLLGHYFPSFAIQLKPLGDGFIRLIKMMIAPIIFCTIVTGIAGMQNAKKVGRVGIKAILYFEVVTTLALIIGLLVINLLKPGSGMHVDPSRLDPEKITSVVKKTEETKSMKDFILNIIPENFMSPLGAKGDVNLLQVLFISLLIGFALSKIGEKGKPVLNTIQSFETGIFTVIKFIMKLAPIGAMGAMAFSIGEFGVGSLFSLGKLMLCFYITCIFFILVVLGSILRLCGFNIFRLLGYIKNELLVVLGTSSSESALPSLVKRLENAGCSEPVVGLVVPTGYSFNLDGTSIYLTMGAVFLAQAIDQPMAIGEQVSLLLILLLTSKGAAGVTGSGLVTLAATLPVVGHIPMVAIGLIIGIDRFMSEGRALTNFIGNAVATFVIARWENELDIPKAKETIG